MDGKSSPPLSFFPEHLIFQDVKLHEGYRGSVQIRNNLSATVDLALRPGSSDRYSIHPEQLRVKPGETESVEIRLKIQKFASLKKAATVGQRDIFHIKSKFFEQKFYATFFFKPETLRGVPCKTVQTPPADATAETGRALKEAATGRDEGMAEDEAAARVAAAVQSERQKQEERNEKVLQLLKQKDAEIARLAAANSQPKSAPAADVEPHETVSAELQEENERLREELRLSSAQREELQEMLEKQRNAFTEESHRLFDFAELCEKQESAGSAGRDFESEIRKLRAEVALRDARVSELAAEKDALELDLEKRRALDSQLDQLKELHAVAKRAALTAEAKLISAQKALDDTTTLKERAEEGCQHYKDLVARTQTRLTAIESSEKKLKSQFSALREEKERNERQWNAAQAELQTQIRYLQQNLSTLQRPVPEDDAPAQGSCHEGRRIEDTEFEDLRKENRDLRVQLAAATSDTDAAQKHIAQLQTDLQQISESTSTNSNPRTTALTSHERLLELHREAATKEQDVRVLKTENQVLQIEVARLRHQLTDAAREASQCQARLVEVERATQSKVEAAERRQLSSSQAQSKELASAQQCLRQCEFALQTALSEKEAVEESLRTQKLNHEKIKAEVENLKSALSHEKRTAAESTLTAQKEISESQRQSRVLELQLDAARAKNTVLMETVETLQVGELGEKEQRIVTSNAQLLQQQTVQLETQSRISWLEAEHETLAYTKSQLESEVDTCSKQRVRYEAEKEIQMEKIQSLEQDLRRMRAETKDHHQTQMTLSQQLDKISAQLRQSHAEREALNEALEATTTRHLRDIATLREEELDTFKRSLVEALDHDVSREVDETISERLDAILGTLKRLCFQTRHQTEGNDAVRDEAATLLPVFEKYKDLILDVGKTKNASEADVRLSRNESLYWSQKVECLEDALERRTVEWQICHCQNQALHLLMENKDASLHLHAQNRLKQQEMYVKGCWEQNRSLEAQSEDLKMKIRSATASLQQSIQQQRQLENTVHRLELENEALKTPQQKASMVEHDHQMGWEAAVQGLDAEAVEDRDAAIHRYFESEIVKLMLKTDPREKLQALAREVCALKVVENRLMTSLAAAQRKCDALGVNRAKLKAALHQRTLMQSAEPPSALEAPAAQEMHERDRDAANRSHEIYQLRSALDQKEQELVERQSEVEALTSRLMSLQATLEGAVHSHQEALEVSKERLIGEHLDKQRDLENSLEQHQVRIQELDQALEEANRSHERRLREEQIEKTQAVEDAVQQAIRELPAVTQLEQAELRTELQREEAARIEKELLSVQEENLMLQEELSKTKLRVLELEASDETTSTAIASLEKTLQQIEKTLSQNQGRQNRTLTKWRRESREMGGCEGSLGSISRQLVQSKLAEAHAQRKLRVAARVEVELRQIIHDRDTRISELKEILNARSKSCHVFKKQLEAFTKRPCAAQEAPSVTQGDSVEMPGETRERVSQETAKLRIELAKRKADILYLEGELAEAKAAQTDPETSKNETEQVKRVSLEKSQIQEQLDTLYKEIQNLAELVLTRDCRSCPEPTGGCDGLYATEDGIGLLEQIGIQWKELLCQVDSLRSANRRLHQTTQAQHGAPVSVEQKSSKNGSSNGSSRRWSLSERSSENLSSDLSTQCASSHEQSCRIASFEAIDTRVKEIQNVLSKHKRGTGVNWTQWREIRQTIAHALSCISVDVSTLRSASTVWTGSQTCTTHSTNSRSADSVAATRLADATGSQTTLIEKRDATSQTGPLPKDHLQEVKELVTALKCKANKWKQRYRAVRSAFSKLKTRAVTQQAILKEKLRSTEQRCEEQGKEYTVEVQRLQSDSSASSTQRASANVGTEVHGGAVQPHSDRQTDAFQTEITRLQTRLLHERSERKRIVASLKETVKGLRRAGSSEYRSQERAVELQTQLDDALTSNAQLTSSNQTQAHELERLDTERNALADKCLALETEAVHQQRECTKQERVRHEAWVKLLSSIEKIETRMDRLDALSALSPRCLDVMKFPGSSENGVVHGVASISEAAVKIARGIGTLKEEIQKATRCVDRRWTTLNAVTRYKASMQEFKNDTMERLRELQHERSRLVQDCKASKQREAELRKELVSFHETTAQSTDAILKKHVSEIEDLKLRHQCEKEALWKEASSQLDDVKADTERQVAARTKQEVESKWSSRLRDKDEAIAQAEAERQRVSDEFHKYQRMKAREISKLESRLRSCLDRRSKNRKRQDSHDDDTSSSRSFRSRSDGEGLSFSDDWDATEKLSMLSRELEFEQLEKKSLKEELSAANRREQEADEKLKALNKELRSLKALTAGHATVATERATFKAECEKLRGEVTALKEGVKSAKAESCSRQRALMAAQNTSISDTHTALSMALETEREARGAAETKLASARNTIARKDNVITELRKRVEEVEDAVRSATLAEFQEAQEMNASKLQRLNQSVHQKEAVIKDLTTKLRILEENQNSTKQPAKTRDRVSEALGALYDLVQELSSRVVTSSTRIQPSSTDSRAPSTPSAAIADIVELSTTEIDDLMNPTSVEPLNRPNTLNALLQKLQLALSTFPDEERRDGALESIQELCFSILSFLSTREGS